MPDSLNILIIDDSLEDRETYKRYLASLNGNKTYFLECETGDDGLEMIENEIFDCILLDYNLPDCDGIDVLSELSQKGSFDIPVIFLTGQGNETIAVQAMKAGAVDYLIKSHMTQDLLTRSVQYAIEKKSTDLKLESYVKELKTANQKIIEQQNSIIEEERLKVILQMAGATAHELNQPLMILLNGIELMEMVQGDKIALKKHMNLLKNAGQRIAEIVKKIQTVRHYKTQPYAGGNEIVKLDQSFNILILEDLDEDFNMLKSVLDYKDQKCLFRANDLDKGYQKLAEEKIDLIFLDYFLPSGTALDFIRYIKRKEIEIPVIVVTASGDEMIASRTIQAGAYDYLPKSKISKKRVKAVIRNTLQRFRVRLEASKAMKEMAKMATYDELTGLFNRKYFNDCLIGEIERSNRYGFGFSLFIADLDHFKNVNDIHGHPVGDKVLIETSKTLKDCLRKGDIPCRYGGEEFVVISPNADTEDSYRICERFRKALEQNSLNLEGQVIKVTVSIGATTFIRDKDDSHSLIKRADKALYMAKKEGRNRIFQL